MRSYLYKLTSDRGGAPCAPDIPGGPLLSLAICKPAIRRTARPGDRLFGLTSRVLEERDGYPAFSVIYAAVVDEVVDAAVYYADASAFRGRPDCIYRYDPELGTLEHTGRTGLHADPRHRQRDLGREGIFENGRILLCRQFTYLGAEAAVMPECCGRLRAMVASLGQGHRVIAAGKDPCVEAELERVWRAMQATPTRFTAAEVHADSYDHPAPSAGELTRSRRGAGVCSL